MQKHTKRSGTSRMTHGPCAKSLKTHQNNRDLKNDTRTVWSKCAKTHTAITGTARMTHGPCVRHVQTHTKITRICCRHGLSLICAFFYFKAKDTFAQITKCCKNHHIDRDIARKWHGLRARVSLINNRARRPVPCLKVHQVL